MSLTCRLLHTRVLNKSINDSSHGAMIMYSILILTLKIRQIFCNCDSQHLFPGNYLLTLKEFRGF